MTTVEDFNLPDSCANCSSLRESIERYYETTDDLTNNALAIGMESERLELALNTGETSRCDAAEGTAKLLEAALKIASSLRIQTQHEMNVADAFCDGTLDPTSTTLQACRFVKSVIE